MGVRSTKWLSLAVAAVIGLGGIGAGVSKSLAADKGEDSAITVIMKKAFKGAKPGGKGKPSLVGKAVDGSATPEELKSLLGYCQDLAKQKAPKGEQKDWDERVDKMVKAVEKLEKGDKTAAPDLKAGANCKECHTKHKED